MKSPRKAVVVAAVIAAVLVLVFAVPALSQPHPRFTLGSIGRFAAIGRWMPRVIGVVGRWG